jgi:hypothetical protein
MPEPSHRLGGAERCRGLGEQFRRAGDVSLEARRANMVVVQRSADTE